MDGVDNVEFNGLEITDIVETSALGSELCGVYWDGLFQKFMGGGNTLQNSPYLYGYTGNRVHGIFSDWAQFTLKGDIVLGDFECTTGMIRGLGFYTSSEVTFDSESTLKISNFNAGSSLYDINTKFLRHPYAQSKAKPIHALWTRTDSDNNTFYRFALCGKCECKVFVFFPKLCLVEMFEDFASFYKGKCLDF